MKRFAYKKGDVGDKFREAWL